MKKKLMLAVLSVVPLVMCSCSTVDDSVIVAQPLKIQDYKRDDYVMLDNVSGEAKSFRLWILFIPLGGKTDAFLQKKAYDNAQKAAAHQKADGVLEPHYVMEKHTVPLILFGWTTKKVTAEVKGWRLKSEAEYQKDKSPAPVMAPAPTAAAPAPAKTN